MWWFFVEIEVSGCARGRHDVVGGQSGRSGAQYTAGEYGVVEWKRYDYSVRRALKCALRPSESQQAKAECRGSRRWIQAERLVAVVAQRVREERESGCGAEILFGDSAFAGLVEKNEREEEGSGGGTAKAEN